VREESRTRQRGQLNCVEAVRLKSIERKTKRWLIVSTGLFKRRNLLKGLQQMLELNAAYRLGIL
jgi:hypothetical protein